MCPQVRERIDEGKYRRWDNFERDMMLIFENAKLFHFLSTPSVLEKVEQHFKCSGPDRIGAALQDSGVHLYL